MDRIDYQHSSEKNMWRSIYFYYGREIIGFGWYLFAVYRLLSIRTLGPDTMTLEVYAINFVLLLLAIPLLYFWRISEYFGWDGGFAVFLSSLTKTENVSVGVQIKMFHIMLYSLLVGLALLNVLF